MVQLWLAYWYRDRHNGRVHRTEKHHDKEAQKCHIERQWLSATACRANRLVSLVVQRHGVLGFWTHSRSLRVPGFGRRRRGLQLRPFLHFECCIDDGSPVYLNPKAASFTSRRQARCQSRVRNLEYGVRLAALIDLVQGPQRLTRKGPCDFQYG